MADEPNAPDNSSEFVEIDMSAQPPAEGDGEAPAEAIETPPAGDGEQPKPEGQDGDDKPEADGNDEAPLRDDKGRYKGGVQGRIDELTKARREAERQVDYWKGIATRNGAQSGEDAAPQSKPTPDDYEDYGEYVEALTDWKVGDRARKEAGSQVENAAKAVETHRAAEWSAKVGAVKANIADFDAVMDKADAPTMQHVAEAIMDADRGPELLYHLAQNPDLVGKLNEMSPYRAAIELGRIEATLGEPAAPPPAPRDTKQTKAPAPITPVTPGSSTAKDPSKMDMEEYKAHRKAQGIR